MKKRIYFLSIVIKYLCIPLSAQSPAITTTTLQQKENLVAIGADNLVFSLQPDTATFLPLTR